MNFIPTIQEIELESSFMIQEIYNPMHKEHSYLKYCHDLQVRSVPTHRPRYTVPTACLEPVALLTAIFHNISTCTLFKYIWFFRHRKFLKTLQNIGIAIF